MAANMKHLCLLVIVLVASAVSEVTEEKRNTTTTSKTTTTTTTSTTTTPATTTTTAPTTTTTTTTTTPVTTKTTTTTTTTTTAKPTTTPAPLDYWVVKDPKTGVKCILMQAKIDITYNNVNMTVPAANNGSKAFGSCGLPQWIMITFSGSNLMLIFNDTTEPGKHRLIGLSLNGTSLNISTTKFWANDKGLLSDKMYKCDAKQDLYKDGNNTIAVSGMKLEVFRNSNSTTFNSNIESCLPDSSKVNNLVPIIVGACLGGLILIVLIAYLIGRKRSRHGYEQV